MESKKLYRSNSNKVFAGVCGGLGDYFNVDPVIVRLIWAAVTVFSGGTGLVGYIIAALVIPKLDESNQERSNTGCLVALLVVMLCAMAIPMAIAVIGAMGVSMFSGVGHMIGAAGTWPMLPWNYAFLSQIVGFFAVLAIVALIVIVVMNRKKGG